LLAQLAPGCEIHFKVIEFDQALELGQKSEREFSLVRDVILEKLKTTA
jgi:allophanate hydrolase subunit 2